MKKTDLVILIIFLLGFAYSVEEIKPATCYHFYEDAEFNIEKLFSSEEDYKYVLPDSSTIYYNYCGFVKNKCNTSVNNTDSYGVKVSSDLLQCTQLTSNQLYSNLSIIWNLIDEAKPGLGASLLLSGGDNYSETLRYQFKYIMNCNYT